MKDWKIGDITIVNTDEYYYHQNGFMVVIEDFLCMANYDIKARVLSTGVHYYYKFKDLATPSPLIFALYGLRE